MDLKKQKTKIELVTIVLAVTLLTVLAHYGDITGFAVAGTITSQRLVWSDGSTATLVYDDNTSTYADFSSENDNMLCYDNKDAGYVDEWILIENVIIPAGASSTLLLEKSD